MFKIGLFEIVLFEIVLFEIGSFEIGLVEFGSYVHCIEDLIKSCQAGDHAINKEVTQIFLDAHTDMITWLENGSKPESTQVTEGKVRSVLGKERQEQTPVGQPQSKPKKDSPTKAASNTNKKVVIRVNKTRIDELINLTGELSSQLAIVEREQMLRRSVSNKEKTAFSYALKYLASLEELSLSLSMQPMENLFQRLERACKDVSSLTNKELNNLFYVQKKTRFSK